MGRSPRLREISTLTYIFLLVLFSHAVPAGVFTLSAENLSSVPFTGCSRLEKVCFFCERVYVTAEALATS